MDGRLFANTLLRILDVHKVNKRIGTRSTLLYAGLSFTKTPVDWAINYDTIPAIVASASDKYLVARTDTSITVSIPTTHYVNDNIISKVVTLNRDGTWTLSVGGRTDVDLPALGLAARYTTSMLPALLQLVQQLRLCSGKKLNTKVECVSRHTEWRRSSIADSAEPTRRSKACTQVLHVCKLTECCRLCQRIRPILHVPAAKQHQDDNYTQSIAELRTLLEEALPRCPQPFRELIISQQKADTAQSTNGVRWSDDMIRLCLSLYCRSPSTYHQLGASAMLKLPSGRLLRMYKNNVRPESGLNEAIFRWMLAEAETRRLSPADRQGGLLIDEMSIQPDLQMVRDGDGFQLVGFTALGPELEAAGHIKGKGERRRQLATHVLQLLFLGFGGFRFPIAHYPCTQASATELHIIVWSAVEMLSSYGFPVLYISMDGAITNRQMMNIQFPASSSPSSQSFLAPNPIPNQHPLAFIMDYSHVMKKIQNSLLNSRHGGTRLIEDGAGRRIVWDFWVEAYNHSRSAPLEIHRHLTHQHIFPENSDKMRNHLAEAVLNTDMLQLMLGRRSYIGVHGVKFDAAISLLQRTSILVAIFRDQRPICDEADPRLQQLRDVLVWFKTWENDISIKYATPGERNRRLLTAETRQDVDSCITGSCAMLQVRARLSPGSSVVPARLNSDAIENTFCQQRGEH